MEKLSPDQKRLERSCLASALWGLAAKDHEPAFTAEHPRSEDIELYARSHAAREHLKAAKRQAEERAAGEAG